MMGERWVGCIALFMVPPLASCSFAFAHGPPERHEEQLYFDCTSGAGAPAADTGQAVAYGLTTAGIASSDADSDGEGGRGAAVAVFGSLTAIFVASAIYGFVARSDCTKAKAYLQERIIANDAEQKRIIAELKGRLAEREAIRVPTSYQPAPGAAAQPPPQPAPLPAAPPPPPSGAETGMPPDDPSTPAPSTEPATPSDAGSPAPDATTNVDAGVQPPVPQR